MEKKILYKVVTIDLKSIWLSQKTRGQVLKKCHENMIKQWIVQYKVGKFVSPKKKSKLFVFKTLEAAKDFRRFMMDESSKIFKVEAKNPKSTTTLLESTPFNLAINLTKYWNKNRPMSLSMSLRLQNAPEKTCDCDAVKLIKEMK